MTKERRLVEVNNEVLPGPGALAAWEIASVTSSILIAEWILSAVTGSGKLIVAIPVGLGFMLMIGARGVRGEGPRDLGFGLDSFVHAMRLLLAPMIIVAVI